MEARVNTGSSSTAATKCLDYNLGFLRKNLKKNKILCNILEVFPALLQLAADAVECRVSESVEDYVPLVQLTSLPMDVAESIYNNGIYVYFKKYLRSPPWLCSNFKYSNIGLERVAPNSTTFYVVLSDYRYRCVYNFQFLTPNKSVYFSPEVEGEGDVDGIYYSLNGKTLKRLANFTFSGGINLLDANLEDFEESTEDETSAKDQKLFIRLSHHGLWVSRKPLRDETSTGKKRKISDEAAVMSGDDESDNEMTPSAAAAASMDFTNESFFNLLKASAGEGENGLPPLPPPLPHQSPPPPPPPPLHQLPPPSSLPHPTILSTGATTTTTTIPTTTTTTDKPQRRRKSEKSKRPAAKQKSEVKSSEEELNNILDTLSHLANNATNPNVNFVTNA